MMGGSGVLLDGGVDATLSTPQSKELGFQDGSKDGDRERRGMSDGGGSSKEAMRDWVFETLANPEFSTLAYIISIVILTLIVISSTTFCLETMKDFDNDESRAVFSILELLCIICFSFEYGAKFIAVRERWSFFKAPMNLVDLVSILPFYIEKALSGISGLGGTRILRIIRLARVFRVLKLGGRMGKLQVVMTAVVESADMLAMLAFLLLLSMILFSTLIYFVETGTQVDSTGEDPFASIPKSFWWCMVTLMTVGYGDVVPATAVGQVVASMTMIASIIILALPISVIGANFTQQWIVFKEANASKERQGALIPKFLKLCQNVTVHTDVIGDISNEISTHELKLEKSLERLRNLSNAPNVEGEMLIEALSDVTELANHVEELFSVADLVCSEEFRNILHAVKVKYRQLGQMLDAGDDIDGSLVELMALAEAESAPTKQSPMGRHTASSDTLCSRESSVSMAPTPVPAPAPPPLAEESTPPPTLTVPGAIASPGGAPSAQKQQPTAAQAPAEAEPAPPADTPLPQDPAEAPPAESQL